MTQLSNFSAHYFLLFFRSINEESSSEAALNVGGQDALKQKVKVGGLFALWYALNVGYNIFNKRVLNAVPQLTYTVAFLHVEHQKHRKKSKSQPTTWPQVRTE